MNVWHGLLMVRGCFVILVEESYREGREGREGTQGARRKVHRHDGGEEQALRRITKGNQY